MSDTPTLIQDEKRRRAYLNTRRCKRLSTLLRRAHDFHTLCEAQVYLVVQYNDQLKKHVYHSFDRGNWPYSWESVRYPKHVLYTPQKMGATTSGDRTVEDQDWEDVNDDNMHLAERSVQQVSGPDLPEWLQESFTVPPAQTIPMPPRLMPQRLMPNGNGHTTLQPALPIVSRLEPLQMPVLDARPTLVAGCAPVHKSVLGGQREPQTPSPQPLMILTPPSSATSEQFGQRHSVLDLSMSPSQGRQKRLCQANGQYPSKKAAM